MTNKLYLVSAATWLATAAPLSACAPAAHPVALESPNRPLDAASCALDAYAPATVRPHFDEEVVQKTTVRRLHGADVYIAARPGLTTEWLRHELTPRPGDAPGCALDVAHAEITVASAGPGFLVTIRARDEAAGGEILRRARATQASAVAAR